MDKTQIIETYRRRAHSYNFDVKFFNLIGWRVNYYRKLAVNAIKLREGDTVVDLCCGTGLNFPHLYQAVGPQGRIIGVDLSAEMLQVAERQVGEKGWENVSLVQSDATDYRFPEKINGIITSYAITLIPEYDQIIQLGAKSLYDQGRFVILDFKKPDTWPEWFAKLMVGLFIRPYGGTYAMKDRHAWESLEKCFSIKDMEEFYFGSTYIAVGEKNF